MKTTTASEARFFMKVLPEYYRHMKDYRSSLLCRFFGLHRIKPGKNHLLIMGNIFDTERIIHQRYDLKGSTVGRSVSEAERKKPTVILKDLDFLNETKSMKIGAERKNVLITQIRADCCFLQFLGVMDYSLLLGIHFRDDHETNTIVPSTRTSSPGDTRHAARTLIKTGSLAFSAPEKTHTSDFQQHDGGWCSQETLPNGQLVTGKEIYFVGIIDYLQFYNTRKRTETILKGFTYNRHEISAVDPKFYSSRFCNFMCSMME
jgi:1-phosphatidylinositol-4-phosphate 5-kinase